MSTDLTTTLLVWDEGNPRRPDGGRAALRFFRNPDGVFGIRGAMPAETDQNGFSAMYLSEEDAVMLRDWLNDEWPVEGTAQAAAEIGLWGNSEGTVPLAGCPCPECEKARGR